MGGPNGDQSGFISLLLDDVAVIGEASSETLCDQKLMQVGQARYTHAWRPKHHAAILMTTPDEAWILAMGPLIRRSIVSSRTRCP